MMNSKTVSLKDKKMISEKLRNENKKMEARLQQLKLTMSKEKEDRLLSGNNSMWSNGAPGAVLNYKPNLLTIDKNKKVKLKILREEDEIMPHNRKGPLEKQNLRHIFNEEVLSNRSENVSRESVFCRDDHTGGKRKCGQCEEALAAVNCNECTEVYCARCFAAFHLKGALRKHRSTPISNLSNRVSIPSPLFKPPNFKKSLNNEKNWNESINPPRVKHDISDDSSAYTSSQRLNSKENQSPKPHGPSLANGDYDEALSTQYFQDALSAWRSGEEPPHKPSVSPKMSTAEHATETLTTNNNQALLSDTIKFTSSLSYAEKLLLRKHRSCQLQPVEMKHILNRLAKNNEAEFLENQKLLQSNLMLKTSAINATLENGFLSDDVHVDIGCLTQLWSEAAFLGEREPSADVQLNTNVGFVSNSGDGFNEYVGTTERRSDNVHSNQKQYSYADEVVKSDECSAVKATFKEPLPELSKLRLPSRTSHSATSRKNFNDRPQSARRMSARNDRGGMITTKPSVLLNVLASFNDYLPTRTNGSVLSNVPSGNSCITRPNSTGTSRTSTKLNYNFYKTSPQSWKPAQAWSETDSDINADNEMKTVLSVEGDSGIVDEYEEELRKLDFFSHYTNSDTRITPAVLNRSSCSSSTLSGNGNVPGNVEMAFYDKEAEDQESRDQLLSFERELTALSGKQGPPSDTGDYEEILADSLDLMESENFQFEDSLDFGQGYSNDAEDKDNCSSRFDDYDDVHNLR